jgi:dipeptidyl aminopeptidase/acylaminoacyl peptidase
MKKSILFLIFFVATTSIFAQATMTPELLWQLKRVSAVGMSTDGNSIIYRVSTPDLAENKSSAAYFSIQVAGGSAKPLDNIEGLVKDKNVSPDGTQLVYSQKVKMQNVFGSDRYSDLPKSNVMVYDALDYRHWDTDHDGEFHHVFFKTIGDDNSAVDIMAGMPYHAPQQPFGGDEDFIWAPDGSSIIYVSKKKVGTAAATSTNSDLYQYDLATGETVNLTEKNVGYDTQPSFSPTGDLTWLQMKRDGYEADKNDIIVRHMGIDINLTAQWDETVQSYTWDASGKKLYFSAAINGTLQVFEVNFVGLTKKALQVNQVTTGDFDVTSIVGISGTSMIVTRTDFNHASEIFSYDMKAKAWKQLTQANTDTYSKIAGSKVERRWITTTDNKKMLVWVILPPNFDQTKKYPTLLYCQGGPQGALTQFYSFRWNLQLMAAQGYIIVAPNRRGMPGHGTAWNEQISKDWGGQVMDDYLTAIDSVAREGYVDKSRLGAVGASYGGYSVFQLAAIHNDRFKTLIAHAGVFNTESMYGTTEELFFVNWDLGGPYWDKGNALAQKSYNEFNPINRVSKWNTPILIMHGAKDYRVPIGQGQEAFQAAQLQGIKSRFVFFPDDNHWISSPQNAMVWQREFFSWLEETL